MVGKRNATRGFTYLTALFSIALIGASISSYAVIWSQEVQRESEQELLLIGEEFRAAIGSYYEQSPGSVKRFPGKLDDLLFDTRYLTMKRHLRRVYVDPVTGSSKWGLVPASDGGFMGVHSLSDKRPIKVAGFDPLEADFSGANRYSDWRFIYRPPMTAEPHSQRPISR